MKPLTMYCAVRKDTYDGHEYLDVSSLSGLMEEAQRKVKEMNTRCRMWGEANPVVRYATCELKEKENGL